MHAHNAGESMKDEKISKKFVIACSVVCAVLLVSAVTMILINFCVA